MEVLHMSNILIVTDSTICMTVEQAKAAGIEMVPLSVLVDGQEYRDQVNLSSAELVAKLRAKAVPKTAQPNLGLLDELMKQWKSDNYEHIIVFALSAHLSGTYQAFRLAATENDMKNLTLVDSLTLASPLRHVSLRAVEMVKAGATVDEILAMAKSVFDDTVSYLYPENLDQLNRSGRVSNGVTLLSSLLKIKPVLVLENAGVKIDKLGTARTETKVFDMIVEDLKKNNISKDTHKLYLLHCEALDTANRAKDALVAAFGDITTEVLELPAVLAAHAGLGTIAIQAARLV
jgi:DegV family protein with EDD domain